MTTIIIATIGEWNIENYFLLKKTFSNQYNFILLTNPNELTKESLKKLMPKYIFFPHWSWIIPSEIHQNYECIGFHMTDLPYGRGGSPFQNLIMQEHYNTKISVLKIEKGLDTGDIYLQKDLDISIGSAEENFMKISKIIFAEIIPQFLSATPTARPQQGDITTFKRREPKESNIEMLQAEQLYKIYDFIRMLDAEGYPKAFFQLENFKIELSEVHQKNNRLTGRFEVKENE